MQTEPYSTNPTLLCKTMSVPDAGRLYFGLSRNSSYEAAARGEIPTIRIGRKIRVPIAALERMLDAAGTHTGPTEARGSQPAEHRTASANQPHRIAAPLTDEQIEAIGRAAVAETRARYAASGRTTP